MFPGCAKTILFDRSDMVLLSRSGSLTAISVPKQRVAQFHKAKRTATGNKNIKLKPVNAEIKETSPVFMPATATIKLKNKTHKISNIPDISANAIKGRTIRKYLYDCHSIIFLKTRAGLTSL